jgi:tetratricopeptide (TPR) repeat protein
MLARAYGSQGDLASFEYEMKRAEDLAHQAKPQANGIYLPYNLGSVYEKYAQFYAQQGRLQKSLKYIDEAEKSIPPTRRWQMKTKMTKGEVLIRSVAIADQRDPQDILRIEEFQRGLELIAEASAQAQQYHHRLLLRQANRLCNILSKQGTKWLMIGHTIEDVLKHAQDTSDEFS